MNTLSQYALLPRLLQITIFKIMRCNCLTYPRPSIYHVHKTIVWIGPQDTI